MMMLRLIAVMCLSTRAAATPLFLPTAGANRYIFDSRVAAAAACKNHSKVLCPQAALVNHSMCEAGWCADYEGYWMGSPCPSGCGQSGFNDWSGAAGAYCCDPPPPLPPPGSPGRPRVVGWFSPASKAQAEGFPIEDIDFSIVTHIVAGAPNVSADGTVTCDPASRDGDKLYEAVRAHDAKIQWSFDTPPAEILTNMTNRENFLRTVREAVEACDSDGMEFDYEGPPSPAVADVFTTLLIDIKKAVCQGNSSCSFVISADSEPPQWSDYYKLNASKMDGKNIDFVNYMSYFDPTPTSDVSRWNESIDMLLADGYPASTINLAIPYYSNSGGAWTDMCHSCPDLAYDNNNCSGAPIVGKLMNERIGALAVERGIGGLFPWMLSYDNTGTMMGGCVDNSLFQWMRRGMLNAPGNHFSPSPPHS
jgi:hypothetical protein